VKTLCDLKGNILSTTTTTQALADFDEFGFVKKSTVTSLDGTTVATTSNFSHNVAGANWLLGRLSSAAITKSLGGKPTISKDSSFGYHSTTGLLTSETVEPGNSLSVTKSYVHDGFGNVTSSTVSASGLTRTGTTTYNPTGRFVLSEKNSLNQTVTYNYDAQRSLLLSTTDIAGNTSSFQ
jgi:YD repeat-containing protein